MPGLRPQHLAAVRAATLVYRAPRSEAPSRALPTCASSRSRSRAGDYRFEIATAGAATLVLQTVLAPLATARERSRVEVIGRHARAGERRASSSWPATGRERWRGWASRRGFELVRAGFYPPGGGEIRASVSPWAAARRPRRWRRAARSSRSAACRGRARCSGDVARRQADATRERLWEARRLESAWEVADVPAASPGSFLYVEADLRADRGRPSASWARRGCARRCWGTAPRARCSGSSTARRPSDPHLADQLAVPLAIGGGGGRISTSEVTPHLVTVAEVVSLFGIPAQTWGRVGGPGGIEVAAR